MTLSNSKLEFILNNCITFHTEESESNRYKIISAKYLGFEVEYLVFYTEGGQKFSEKLNHLRENIKNKIKENSITFSICNVEPIIIKTVEQLGLKIEIDENRDGMVLDKYILGWLDIKKLLDELNYIGINKNFIN